MKREKHSGTEKTAGRRRKYAAGMIVILAVACAAFAWLKLSGGETSVEFEPVEESRIPQDISTDVIPEYKTLERALACKVDDDIYVIVTRGEKPTSGFGVAIDRMAVEETDGKTSLIVYAAFDDPQKETAISQIITYPLQVVKTDLETLPDAIELRIQY